MVKLHGVARVLDTKTVKVKDQTLAELQCADFHTHGRFTVYVRVNKHGDFLKGKIVAFDAVLTDDGKFVADLKDVFTLDAMRRSANGGNGSGHSGNGNSSARYSTSNGYSRKERTSEFNKDDDEIPF